MGDECGEGGGVNKDIRVGDECGEGIGASKD